MLIMSPMPNNETRTVTALQAAVASAGHFATTYTLNAMGWRKVEIHGAVRRGELMSERKSLAELLGARTGESLCHAAERVVQEASSAHRAKVDPGALSMAASVLKGERDSIHRRWVALDTERTETRRLLCGSDCGHMTTPQLASTISDLIGSHFDGVRDNVYAATKRVIGLLSSERAGREAAFQTLEQIRGTLGAVLDETTDQAATRVVSELGSATAKLAAIKSAIGQVL